MVSPKAFVLRGAMLMDADVDPAKLEEYERRAPGWDIRCLKCGFTEPYGKYGIRWGAAGRKYTFGRCGRCRRWGCFVVEKRKDAP